MKTAASKSNCTALAGMLHQQLPSSHRVSAPLRTPQYTKSHPLFSTTKCGPQKLRAHLPGRAGLVEATWRQREVLKPCRAKDNEREQVLGEEEKHWQLIPLTPKDYKKPISVPKGGVIMGGSAERSLPLRSPKSGESLVFRNGSDPEPGSTPHGSIDPEISSTRGKVTKSCSILWLCPAS